MAYETVYSKRQKYRVNARRKALRKLADGKDPKCAICGCPHFDILQIGHPNGDGKSHRIKISGDAKGSRGVVLWVLRTPIEEVKKQVQIECPFCNAWHQKFKRYPEPDERPLWSTQ